MASDTLKELDGLGARALRVTGRVVSALWLRARHNPRMTAAGVASGVAFLGARWGFDLSPEAEAGLALFLFIVLGAAGVDRHGGKADS